jgi:LacI family transcriptional regulator
VTKTADGHDDRDGQDAPQRRTVTSHDIARAAGVSQTTVSRVLSGSDLVRPSTRERVLRVLGEHGYRPNAIARAMVTGRTATIGVVVANVTNPFYPALLEAISEALERSGRRMTLWTSGAAAEPAAIEAIGAGLVDGVIFTDAVADSAALREATRRHAPIVLVNRHVDEVRCDTVTTDNVGGGRAVARHLLDLGHRRIGIVGAQPDLSTAREREDGFRQVLEQVGLTYWAARGDPSFELGAETIQDLAGMPECPSALFCINDITALGVLHGALRSGLSVPDDLSVVGFDNIAMSRWAPFGLTTVTQPIPEMAQLAVRLLSERIEQPDLPPRRRFLEATLLTRKTTARAKLP